MRFAIAVVFFSSFSTLVMGQWYSETTTKGVTIQNSFPKGGPYTDPAGKNVGYSFLIFFTRVINETDIPLELTINFPADSFAIPSSPGIYMKLFLPSDTMTLGKQSLYNYGVTSLESFLDFNKPTMLQRTINPKEECLFYIGTVFYQVRGTTRSGYQTRGGNRAELVLKEQDLFFKMTPQIDYLPCGHIILKK